MCQPNVKITDPFYFRRRFDLLTAEMCRWFETSRVAQLADFDDELPFGDVIYLYGDRMNAPERQWTDEFAARWERLAERAAIEQVCGECHRYTDEMFWKLVGDRLLCQACRRAHRAQSPTVQPSLF